MLVLSRKPEEAIFINGNISVKILKIVGNTVSLGIEAPKDVSVWREEITEAGMKKKAIKKDLLPPGKVSKIKAPMRKSVVPNAGQAVFPKNHR